MKIKIITPDSDRARAWAEALSAADAGFSTTAVVKPLHGADPLAHGPKPDLVVAEAVSMQDIDALDALAAASPDIEYVLVAADLGANVLMRVMRAGVREVLPTSMASGALTVAVLDAVQRLARKRPAAPAGDKRDGKVLTFVSCKGGSGATFAAANLAHVLADGGQRKVALIDLNLQFGDALLFLSSERPASNVADVARNIQRIDPDLLLSAMVPVSPGLHVLAAPEDPAQAIDVSAEHVEAIVRLARSMFDIVILDSGRSLSPVTLKSLDMADQVFVVLQLTLPYIRDGKRLRDVFRSLDYPESKIHWVVNRHEKSSRITLDDLKITLGLGQFVTLPNQYDVVANSVNQGVPVATVAPGSAITQSLTDWARQIAPQATQARRAGWLSGLFGQRPAATAESREAR